MFTTLSFFMDFMKTQFTKRAIRIVVDAYAILDKQSYFKSQCLGVPSISCRSGRRIVAFILVQLGFDETFEIC